MQLLFVPITAYTERDVAQDAATFRAMAHASIRLLLLGPEKFRAPLVAASRAARQVVSLSNGADRVQAAKDLDAQTDIS